MTVTDELRSFVKGACVQSQNVRGGGSSSVILSEFEARRQCLIREKGKKRRADTANKTPTVSEGTYYIRRFH